MHRQLTVQDVDRMRAGQTTLAELRGVDDRALRAGVRAGRRMLAQGEHQAAAELLAGLALYDPYRPDVWRALEDLCRRERNPQPAALYARLAVAMGG